MNVEEIKTASHGLRGTIAEGLADSSQDGFSQDDQNLIKFHGFYQQRNRDKNLPPEQRRDSFMVRGRVPGGRFSAAQYLKWDELSATYGLGSLRATTRQTLQIHGILKGELRPLLQGIYSVNQTTMGACGDVVRNVTQVVNPRGLPDLALLDAPATLLSEHFQFKSSAWTELWIDEQRVRVPGDENEPFYGETYLPRKFKIGLTVVGDNGIDLYTNDLGLAAETKDGVIQGYFVFAGGGMGMTHGKAETYPRLADLVGYIPASRLLDTAEAVIGVHRDFGDRENRKHARLKYVIQEKGLEWFRSEVEKRQGFIFAQQALPAWKTPSYLGWQERVDHKWSLGVHLHSGRIVDGPSGLVKSALAEIARRYAPDFQFTADQDVILLGIESAHKADVEDILNTSGYAWKSKHPLHDRALACVSLPTCPLALTDAELALQGILDRLQERLEAHGLAHTPPIVRVTGCPNGCARPYSAEIGIVGQAPGKYALFVGGTPSGDRVARLYAQKIPLDQIAQALDPIFLVWRQTGHPGESLGDLIQRLGWEAFFSQAGLAAGR